MSELLSADLDKDISAVFDLLLDPVSVQLQVAEVARHASGLGVIAGSLVVFFNLGRFLFPAHHVENATIGDDLSFECVVDSFNL